MSEKRQTESSNKEAQVAPMLELDEAMREMFGITRMEELWGLKAPALYLKVGTGDIYTDTGACCLPYAKTVHPDCRTLQNAMDLPTDQETQNAAYAVPRLEYLLARTVFRCMDPMVRDP